MNEYQPYFDRDEIRYGVVRPHSEGGGGIGHECQTAGEAILKAWDLMVGVDRSVLVVTEIHQRRGSSASEHRPLFTVEKIDTGIIKISDHSWKWKGAD